jgi:hypothetical protein
VNPAAMRVARKFSDWFRCHDVLLLSSVLDEERAFFSAGIQRSPRPV